MASRRPAVQHRPGRDQLLPVRVDWAEEVDLHVKGGKVGAALGRRLDSGGGDRHVQQGVGAPKTVPYFWFSHPLAGTANTARPVSISRRWIPINRSIGGPAAARRRMPGGFKHRLSLERRGGMEDSNPAPYCFVGQGQNG
jgi:hypothetical protein